MELFGWPAPNPVLNLLSGHSSALTLCPNSPNLAHFLSPAPTTFAPVIPFVWNTVHPTPFPLLHSVSYLPRGHSLSFKIQCQLSLLCSAKALLAHQSKQFLYLQCSQTTWYKNKPLICYLSRFVYTGLTVAQL